MNLAAELRPLILDRELGFILISFNAHACGVTGVQWRRIMVEACESEQRAALRQELMADPAIAPNKFEQQAGLRMQRNPRAHVHSSCARGDRRSLINSGPGLRPGTPVVSGGGPGEGPEPEVF